MATRIDVMVRAGGIPDGIFTYGIRSDMRVQPGSLVEVPLGNRTVTGVVRGHSAKNPPGLKMITRVVSAQPLVPSFFFELARFSAERWFTTEAQAFWSFVPAAITTKKRPFADLVPFGFRPARAPRAQQITGAQPKRWEQYQKLLKALPRGARALVLLPNRILAKEFVQQQKSPQVLHWDVQSVKEIRQVFMLARQGAFRAIVGTRSAALSPFPVDLIIIDDPHHYGFVSDRAPRSNSLALLIERSRLEHSQLVAGSGTLSYAQQVWAARSRIAINQLGTRPPVRVVELKRPPLEGSVLEEIEEALRRKIPVVVYHNRSGATRWEICLGCYQTRPASETVCLNCQSTSFKKVGFDVRDLATLLHTQTNQSVEVVVGPQRPKTLKGPLIVGTRALFEHRLPLDYLGIMVDADSALVNPRFDSIEELLLDAGELCGARQLLIQTRQSEHPVFKDWWHWPALLKDELKTRRQLGLPPFGRFIEVHSLRNNATALERIATAARSAGLGVRVSPESVFVRGLHQQVRAFLEDQKLHGSTVWRIIPEPRTF